MRLQVATALAALLSSDLALADGRASGFVSYYAASDNLTVISPQVSLKAPVSSSVEAEAGYEADIITSASVDVVTSASPRGYREVRNGLSAGLSYRPTQITAIGAKYLPSWEPDYRSHTITLGAEAEWLSRRLTTQLGYRLSLDLVGRSGEPAERWRDLRVHALTIGLGAVVSPTLVADFSYEGQLLGGFMASPYRYVRVGAGAPALAGVPEQVPDTRARHALSAGIRKALGGGYFLRVSYRVYTDSWGLLSHTEALNLERAFGGDRFIVGLSARVYGQGAASFYQRRYTLTAGEMPRYRTADKMLAPQWSLLAGPRAELGLGSAGPFTELRVSGRLEAYHQRFLDFEPLSARQSLVLTVGLWGEL